MAYTEAKTALSERLAVAFTPLQAKRETMRRRILRIAILSLIIWPLLAWGMARALIVSAEPAHADALVVLSGSTAYVERTRWAARLFDEGRAPKIILTNDDEQGGWSSAQQRNPFFFERAAEELQRAGVPVERIEVLPQAVSSTYEEAMLLREYMAAQRLHSVLVVTSAYHSRRALWTLRRVFRGSGVEVMLAAVAPGGQSPAPATWWLHPRGWRMVAAEYPKLVYYWLRYR